MKNFSLFAILFFCSCTIAPRITVTNAGNGGMPNVIVDGKIFATAYQQKAAEYRALCLQAFNIARERIDEIILRILQSQKRSSLTLMKLFWITALTRLIRSYRGKIMINHRGLNGQQWQVLILYQGHRIS